MKIHDYVLPTSFVDAIKSREYKRRGGIWRLRDEVDSFGNPLETEFPTFYRTKKAILQHTTDLPTHFATNDAYGQPSDDLSGPGAISDIVDFHGVIAFGYAGGGEPFCFDFRETPDAPAIIWWDDIYWRRISDDFHSFLDLFEFKHKIGHCK